MGDAISHSVLPGIIISYLLSIPLIIGAFCSGMVCAVLSGFLSENSRLKHDTIMGIVFSGMFGFGIVLYSKVSTEVHLDHILFGNILGINFEDLLISFLISSWFILTKPFDVQLFLPGLGLALGVLDRDAGVPQLIADRPHHVLFLGGLQDVIVFVVA